MQLDESELITTRGTSIRWDEVVAVHANKIDAMTHSVTMLTLDHECGEFIEIPTGEDGFEALRDHLGEYLPLPADWYQQIESLDTGESVTLMERQS